jgi:acyl CoA:acetate/3-ketoacid CoA transferase
MDITTHARKLVFSGFFRAGGLQVDVVDGQLKIRQEGAHAKLVRCVDQVTFNGRLARKRGTEVLVVTERGVLRAEADSLRLIEVAPGIDPHRDIVDRAGAQIRLDPHMREMDARLFRPERMQLRLDADSMCHHNQ